MATLFATYPECEYKEKMTVCELGPDLALRYGFGTHIYKDKDEMTIW